MPFRIKFFSISNKVKIILVFWGEIWGEYGIKKRNPLINRGLQVLKVVPQGFEPQPAEPKSDVLPLHHGTILICFVKSKCKSIIKVLTFQIFRPQFIKKAAIIVSF